MSKGPITPKEVLSNYLDSVPIEVFDVFNELIVANYDGVRESVVRQRDAIDGIVSKTMTQKQYVLDKGWLNIEAAYRKAGWNVEYHKPDRDENYEAFFRFTI